MKTFRSVMVIAIGAFFGVFFVRTVVDPPKSDIIVQTTSSSTTRELKRALAACDRVTVEYKIRPYFKTPEVIGTGCGK